MKSDLDKKEIKQCETAMNVLEKALPHLNDEPAYYFIMTKEQIEEMKKDKNFKQV